MKKLTALTFAALLVSACGSDPEPGEAGKDGASSLVRLDEEAKGANCPTGGTAIRSGVDSDGDGVLSDDEVVTTRYLCNGSNELVRLEEEAPGDNCEFGGTAVFTGVDANGDGVLSSEEAGAADYVCNGFGAGANSTWEGDYKIENPTDALALRGIRRVTGNLTLYGMDGMDTLSLASLEKVEGSLRIEETYGEGFGVSVPLSRVNLPRLNEVGGNVTFTENAVLNAVDLSSLAKVGGDFRIYYNYAIQTLSLPALAEVGNVLEVHSNDVLGTLSLQALGSVKTFEVHGNPLLESLSAPVLTSVSTKFTVKDNPELPSTQATDLKAQITSTPAPTFDVCGNLGGESCS